jgi:hypothetical protein
MSEIVGAAVHARAEEILGRPATNQDEYEDALRQARAQLAPDASELEVRVRALELWGAPGVESRAEARKLAELEHSLGVVPGPSRPTADEVQRVAASIARDRGKRLDEITDEDELVAVYAEARELAEREIDGRRV